jgi:hypothetical protein
MPVAIALPVVGVLAYPVVAASDGEAQGQQANEGTHNDGYAS